MAQISEQTEANLKALQAESGTPWRALAVDMDNYDPAVAAWMRSQDAGTSAPKGRRSKGSAESNEG